MSKLKSFEDFVNENLVTKGEYNFYGPGSLKPLVQKLVGEGKNESIIRTYLTSIGVVPWRIDKVMQEMAETITIEKKVNESVNEDVYNAEESSFPTAVKKEIAKFFKVKNIKDVKATDSESGDEYEKYKKGSDWEMVHKKLPKLSAEVAGNITYSKKLNVLRVDDYGIEVYYFLNESEESINEGKKIKPFKKVKIGDKATDYNGDTWNVIAIGKVKDLAEYDDSGAAEELDPNEDAIALDGRGGTAVFSYDPDGAAVYEAKKAKLTFEENATKFLKDINEDDEVNEGFEVKKLDKGNNYDWEFEIKDPVNKKLYKELTINKIEFGTLNGKLVIMGDGDQDNAVPAIRILAKFGIRESVNEAKKKTFEDATAAFLLGLQGSDVVNDDENIDEAVGVLTIAGGIVLGVVGVIALVNGAQVAAIVAGKAIVNAAEKADAKKAAKRAADKLADKKAILEPIVKKFENDDVLKKMYAELTPYMGTSNAKNRAASKLRTKEMAEIAKYIKSKLTPEELGYFTDLSKYLRTGTFENNEFYLDAKRVNEKLNKKTLQVEEGDGEDIDDMIDDLADGDEDETQGPDDSAPDGEDSPESKIKDGESPEDATEGGDDASSKIAAATKELEKDSKKLAKLKKILLDESTTNEDLTRMVNDGAMSELHLLAKEAKDEKDFIAKAKDFVKDQGAKFDGLEKMFKEFYSDMKNESVKETKEVTIDDDGEEVEDTENITDTKTGDEIQVEEPQEESTSNAYMDAVTEGLKYRFNK
jgi:hypothetical protein